MKARRESFISPGHPPEGTDDARAKRTELLAKPGRPHQRSASPDQILKRRLIAEGMATAKATRERKKCEALIALKKHQLSGR